MKASLSIDANLRAAEPRQLRPASAPRAHHAAIMRFGGVLVGDGVAGWLAGMQVGRVGVGVAAGGVRAFESGDAEGDAAMREGLAQTVALQDGEHRVGWVGEGAGLLAHQPEGSGLRAGDRAPEPVAWRVAEDEQPAGVIARRAESRSWSG
jgi:hypothetical protein